MALHIPKEREVLVCDFGEGSAYAPPEIYKNRPVVILCVSPARPRLAIVVPLSTSAPDPQRDWHHLVSRKSSWDRTPRWAKCDLVQPVSYDRLSAYRLKGRTPEGKRRYLHNFFVVEEDFEAIRAGVVAAMKLQP